jgi:hypothetical protein
MTDDTRITTDELTDEQIERILNTRGFQKMLAYQQLASGIDVLEDQDEIYASMVTSITNQHTNVGTESSVEEVLTLFQEEVRAFTEPLAGEDDEQTATADDLEDIMVEETDA